MVRSCTLRSTSTHSGIVRPYGSASASGHHEEQHLEHMHPADDLPASTAAPFAGTGRLFILGSGFSASFGLPTLQMLFPALMTPAADAEDVMRVISALRRLYPHFTSDTSASSYPAFEEFLGLVMAAEDTPPFPSTWWVK